MERFGGWSRHSWLGGVLGLLLLAAPGQAQVAGTPWSGSQDQGAGTPAAGDTNHIDIVFDPSHYEPEILCDKIVMIQVAQILADGKPMDPGQYYDGYDFQDQDSIDDQDSTPQDETGSHVDSAKTDTTPYYQDTGAGYGSPGSSSSQSSTPATMNDTPHTGGGNIGFPPLSKVTFKFETCAFCAKGEDAGKYFGCILWEYNKTAADKAAGAPGTSKFTGTSGQPSPGFTAAVDQWAANHDFDLP